MSKVDFGKTKERITIIEKAKNEKRVEMNNLYKSLTENTEFLDLLMIQIGKDIEENFPGVRFRLISRIKTEKSFADKLENDLIGLVDKKRIEEVKIYDIIALSIIIDHVPHNIKSNDASFDSHISELIEIRENTKASLKLHEKQLEDYKHRIAHLLERKREKSRLQQENYEKIAEVIKLQKTSKELKEFLEKQAEHLLKLGQYIDSDIESIDDQVRDLQNDIGNMEAIIERTIDRFDKEDNECNHAMADFLIKNITKFDNVKALNLTEIPKRLKQKENYDGYRAVHNCYESRIRAKNEHDKEEEFYFMCEIQGKSIDAFYVADRGKAAKYHMNPRQEPGKIVKSKRLPDILSIKTPEEIEAFREKVRTTVPKFRIYRHVLPKDKTVKSKADVYQLSTKECFLYYYYNQLFGNNALGIQAKREMLEDLIKGDKLSDKDGKKYMDYEYRDVIER